VNLITKKELIQKEAFVWLYYHNRILRVARGFQNKLRAYFSNMYKDVIKNDLKLDFEKWLKELVKIYSEEATKGLNLGLDRAYKEMNANEIGLIDKKRIENIFANFIANEGLVICTSIMKTTERKLNEIILNKEIEDKKKKISEIFEGWKSWRAKMIAKTETYRAFNFAYIEVMKMAGYTHKKWFSPPSERNCVACNKLAGKIVGINNSFAETDERDRLWNGLYPPVHPNDDCILFALKQRELPKI